jgi:hypothetical protein
MDCGVWMMFSAIGLVSWVWLVYELISKEK